MSEYFSFSMASGTPKYPNASADHDIWFDGGKLQTVTKAESVAQRVRQHLEFYSGEWFLDNTVGVPWFEFIYVRPFHKETADSIIKAAIMDVPGVAEILEYNAADTTDKTRGYKISQIIIRSDYDQEVRIF